MIRLLQKRGLRSFFIFFILFTAGSAHAQNNYTASLCSPPAIAPSVLLLTPFSNIITGSFLPSIPAAAGYLVVRTTTSTPPTAPSDGTVYSAGTNALGGYIESVGLSTSFTSSALLPSTSYYYWVIPYNTAFTCAPISYFNTSILSSSVFPVHFISVSAARAANKTITVKWNTGDESGLDHYEAERSAGGISFQHLYSVSPAGVLPIITVSRTCIPRRQIIIIGSKRSAVTEEFSTAPL